MHIPLIYATTEGQTRKIAEFALRVLSETGHACNLIDAGKAEAVDLVDAGAVVVAGSVHAGHYQGDLVRFVREEHALFERLPTLFLSVSLTAAGHDPEGMEELGDVLKRFAAETEWSPSQTIQVAGALKMTEYDFFKAWIMRRIMADKGETVGRLEDREYTDWDALETDLRDWTSRLNAG